MSTNESDGDRATQGPQREARQASAQTQDAGRTTSAEGPKLHESDIFPPPGGPRYFGTGSYEMGGTHAEGSDAIGEVNPLGGYGTFSDAGGPGSTTLYGQEVPGVSGTPTEGEATNSPEPLPANSTSQDPQKEAHEGRRQPLR
jgi:hypothetical protein